jgi:hypothetical protein
MKRKDEYMISGIEGKDGVFFSLSGHPSLPFSLSFLFDRKP